MAGEVARTMSLCEQLITAASACKLPDTATPLDRYLALWNLYQFLDDVPALDIFLSVSYTLEMLAPLLSDHDRDVMRTHGCSFPEDWDNPREFFSQEGEEE